MDGSRICPGLPGVSGKFAKEAKEISAGVLVLVPERSGCVVSAADISKDVCDFTRKILKLQCSNALSVT